MPTLGEVITRLRRDAGLSRHALSKAAKIDSSILARLEYGDREEVRLSTLCRIAQILNVTLDDLAAAAGYIPRRSGSLPSSAAETMRLRAALSNVQSVTEKALSVPSPRTAKRRR